MVKLIDQFIPAASNVLDVKNDRDAECRFFRDMMEQAYAQGLARDSGFQGYYVVTPGGRLLGALHSSRFSLGGGENVGTLLEQSLEKWKGLPRRDRLPPQDPGNVRPFRVVH